MSDALLDAIAELTRQNRELAARVATLERDRAEDRERLNAHGMLLAPPLRRDVVRRERLNAHGMLLAPPSRRDVVRHYEAQLAQIKPARREFLSGGVTYYLPPEAA